jgi:hypothetical protein
MTDSTVFDSAFFSPDFRVWLLTAPLEDIYQEVSDCYKSFNGIRPRWMSESTREEFAEYFIGVSRSEIESRESEKWDADERNNPLEVTEPPALPYDTFADAPVRVSLHSTTFARSFAIRL